MQVRAEHLLAQRVLRDWQAKENSHVPGGKRQYNRQPHRSLGMKTPNEVARMLGMAA